MSKKRQNTRNDAFTDANARNAQPLKARRRVTRANASVEQAVRIILEAYTRKELGGIETEHDHDQQYAVQVDGMQFLVNLEQWNNGLDLDVVLDTDVEEVEFKTWPPRPRTTPAVTATPTRGVVKAVEAHRVALDVAKKAVTEWAAKFSGSRDSVASGMLERLAECRKDRNGETTLNVVDELFSEHVELLEADGANAVAHALGQLGIAAQALGHRRSIKLED